MKHIALSSVALALAQDLCNAASVPSPWHGDHNACRSIPGDPSWPSAAQWDVLNRTTGGKLIASVPLGSVCHDSVFGPYHEDKCNALRAKWYDYDTYLPSSASPMAPFFTNDTCNPFTTRNTSCTARGYTAYAVNATGPADFQRTIAFAREHNIRLVIRNTGHDYNGKSSGAGGLAIWTHYMKSQELVDYKSTAYTGKAVKMGAGVEVVESYQFAHDHGLVSVGGDCPTVGVVGGWTQGGGGHGPGVSKFGLGADQALEWEVVTASGHILKASREQNPDLFWALSGGGGGTYGVVSSLTAKVYPELSSSAAILAFNSTGNTDSYWDVVAQWQSSLLDITASGCFAIWSVSAEQFMLMPANCPDFTLQDYPNFLDSYKAYNLQLPKKVADSQLGSRLIPRNLVLHNNTRLVDTFREIIAMNTEMVFTAVDALKFGSETAHTSVDPMRREAAFSAIISTAYDQTDYTRDITLANKMTNQLIPTLDKLIPKEKRRAYMNEANFQEPDFQTVFYGRNYEPLFQVKQKYDPTHMFYALGAVGSEMWYEDKEKGGRLCPTGKQRE
nr:fad-linked oxidoreductase zeb1 [Quercus suber]